MVNARNMSITYDTIRSRDSATFTGAYQTLGAVLSRPIRIYKIVNNSNVPVRISLNGVNDQDFIPAGSFTLYDVMANKTQTINDVAYIEQGTQFWVVGAAGVGLVYLVCLA